jgi:hypothetical protein
VKGHFFEILTVPVLYSAYTSSLITRCLRQHRHRHRTQWDAHSTHRQRPQSLEDAYSSREWEDLRWIMQLGPHLFAHQGFHPNPNNNNNNNNDTASQQQPSPEELQRQRQTFVHDNLLVKVRYCNGRESVNGKKHVVSISFVLTCYFF